LNYLAVDPAFRRRGIGRRMVVYAEAALIRCGCPKINLQVRETNRDVLAFYKRLGYSTDRVVSLGKRIQ
jgi:ribosomal protein S18 acetylase RimI-like enzyme